MIYLFLGNNELANFIIRGVLVTMMALFGMVANALSTIVFSRPETKSSTMNRLLISKYTRVSVQGVESLWGDCRFIPADWGS